MRWVLILSLIFLFHEFCRAEGESVDRKFLPLGAGSNPESAVLSGRYKIKEGSKSRENLRASKKHGTKEERERVQRHPAQSRDDETAAEKNIEKDGAEKSTERSMKNEDCVVKSETEPPDVVFHPDDIRRNRVELSFFPSYVNYESKSESWYRSYSFISPGLKAEVKAWINPSIGIEGSYFTTSGDIAASSQTGVRLPVSLELLSIGARSRYFYGLGRKSTALELSLSFVENKMKVPSDADLRVTTHTFGFEAGLEVRIPESARYASVYGIKWGPRQSHTEGGTEAGVKSGDSVVTSRIGFNYGGEIVLKRASSFLWKLDYSLEKNSFRGSSTKTDPSTGANYDNISVNQTLFLLSFGYRWAQ